MTQAVRLQPFGVEVWVHSRFVHVGFEVDRVVVGWDRFFSEYFGYPLPASLHQYLMLIPASPTPYYFSNSPRRSIIHTQILTEWHE
jgi:hypothetical protein